MLPAILGLGSAGLYATSATLLYRRLSKREKQPKRGVLKHQCTLMFRHMLARRR